MTAAPPIPALRRSRFAVRSELDGDGVLWTSTRTGAHLLLDREHDGLLAGDAALDPDQLPSGMAEVLLASGMAVPASLDEDADARADHHRARQDRDTLLLTVSPTVACNLACGYCFESEHPVRYLSDEDEANLLRLVQQRLAAGVRHVDVTWFGGEPLLARRSIERLSGRLIRACSFAGATYAATAVTNGTLLDDDVAEMLARSRVERVQITVDGPPDVHDQLRPTAAGGGSFDKTLAGVEAAARHLQVDLRVNVDRRNARLVPRLLDLLVERRLTSVNLGFVRTEPPAVYGPEEAGAIDRIFLTVADFARLEVEWLVAAADRGFPVGVTVDPGDDPTPCAAVKENHLAIEPGGRVARCWADVADDAGVVGTLGPLGVTTTAADDRWRRYEPFDSGCETCPFLPVCWGGCPKARLDGAMAGAGPEERRAFKERYVCSPRKFNLSELARRGLLASST